MILEQFITHFLAIVLSIFPFSFVAFVVSERTLFKHQSRVGLGASFTDFMSRAWANIAEAIKAGGSLRGAFLYSTQASFLALIPFFESEKWGAELPGAFFVCVMMITVAHAFFELNRSARDQKIVRTVFAGGISLLCAASCFVLSQSWSIGGVLMAQKEHFTHWGIFWSPVQIIIFIIFQISGMLFFDEHPFSGALEEGSDSVELIRSRWLGSSQFYFWSLLSATLFFGGSQGLGDEFKIISFLVLQLKAFSFYFIFRLLAFYFPHYGGRAVTKLCLFYLVPITLLLFLAVLIFQGVQHV